MQKERSDTRDSNYSQNCMETRCFFSEVWCLIILRSVGTPSLETVIDFHPPLRLSSFDSRRFTPTTLASQHRIRLISGLHGSHWQLGEA